MDIGIVAKNIIIIGVIAGVAYASQAGFFKPAVAGQYTQGFKNQNSYLAQVEDFAKTNIYPKLGGVSGEVAKTQASLQQNIVEKKNNLVEDSTNGIKKALAKNILKFLGVMPQELQSCPAN